MPNRFQNIDQTIDFIVDEVMETASQVQQGAERIQVRSRMAPQEAPVQVTRNVSGPFTSSGLFWFGLGAVAALAGSYFLWKRGR
jgi:hypothetical protein